MRTRRSAGLLHRAFINNDLEDYLQMGLGMQSKTSPTRSHTGTKRTQPVALLEDLPKRARKDIPVFEREKRPVSAVASPSQTCDEHDKMAQEDCQKKARVKTGEQNTGLSEVFAPSFSSHEGRTAIQPLEAISKKRKTEGTEELDVDSWLSSQDSSDPLYEEEIESWQSNGKVEGDACQQGLSLLCKLEVGYIYGIHTAVRSLDS